MPLYIPPKIIVGFQNRKDTFTGKLGFVTYKKEDEKINQGSAWNGWRNENIEPIEIENKPHKGFILNKGVQRYGYFGSGRSVIRVYDDRDFEFEISVDNLIGILMHSDVSKRDIMEECVFAWSTNGRTLVLLPVNSDEYRQAVEFTEKQFKDIEEKDLKQGVTYSIKQNKNELIYIGKHYWYDLKDSYYTKKIEQKCAGEHHIFYNENTKEYSMPLLTELSAVLKEDVVENLSTLIENYYKTENSQKIIAVEINLNIKEDSYSDLYYIEGDKLTKLERNGIYIANIKLKPETKHKLLKFECINTSLVKDKLQPEWDKIYHYGYYNRQSEEYNKIRKTLTKKLKENNVGHLVLVLENGTKINYK